MSQHNSVRLDDDVPVPVSVGFGNTPYRRPSIADDKPIDPIGSELAREDPSFSDIVVEFVEGLGERLEAMDQAIRTSDFDALMVAAHQLKGSGGGYGYFSLSQQAAGLERDAKAKALDDCVKSFDELKVLCARVVIRVDQ